MASALFRLLYITVLDPPYLPLGPAALRSRRGFSTSEKEKSTSDADGIGGAEYNVGFREGTGGPLDPDSPGLEYFYTKEVFSSEVDGKPKWCSHCANWKPDRTHHCSDAGRCILKMDHFCPWVGGPVGETNFKFFIQYTGYTALYCLHLLVVMAVYIGRQVNTEGETYNPQFTAILGLATFFFLFTAGMTGTSMDLAMNNLTQVERLGAKTRVHTLAILKPSIEQLHHISPTVAGQHNYREITFPLPLTKPPTSADFSTSTSNASNSPLARVEVEGNVPEEEVRSLGSQPALGTSSEPSQGSSTVPVKASTNNDHNERVLDTPGRLNPTAEPRTEIEVITPASANAFAQSRPSNRDLMATRTFAVLDLKQGHNPWDLGTRLLNWETVMGSSVIDWVLPIKRSPCCNHEDTESQFQLGPWVDILKSSYGFLSPEDMRAYGGRRKSERRDVEDFKPRSGHRKRRRRQKRDTGRELPVQLDDLESQAPQPT
ncbi:zf-DHHC-domain-containing protein [Mollisia scopiformis]|uniref:Palmitoyltransferase n=1 Tax=Mollisia scopiformis TaxID=149040 RepID=A0A132BBK6_MOLSC|nr:zf-DHHC-domain-containing protein [Mollisia scopiformis]KUJ09224.1 zf-DHHC-domain-containing protein [Mollisia scopiformis]